MSSGGLEAMTLFGSEPAFIFAMLEKPIRHEAFNRTFSFDTNPWQPKPKNPHNQRADWRFNAMAQFHGPEFELSEGATAVGGMCTTGPLAYVVIERDGGQGQAAELKRLTRWSLTNPSHPGDRRVHSDQSLLADLLHIPDPHDLDGDGSTTFRFPFVTIESVCLVDDRTLLVVNDNNYPFPSGRSPDPPDPTEFILLRYDEPLTASKPTLP